MTDRRTHRKVLFPLNGLHFQCIRETKVFDREDEWRRSFTEIYRNKKKLQTNFNRIIATDLQLGRGREKLSTSNKKIIFQLGDERAGRGDF